MILHLFLVFPSVHMDETNYPRSCAIDYRCRHAKKPRAKQTHSLVAFASSRAGSTGFAFLAGAKLSLWGLRV